MENIKKILITVLSFLVLFSISCDNEGKTGSGGISGGENGGGGSSGGSQSKSELVGTWGYRLGSAARFSFTVDEGGNIEYICGGTGFRYTYKGKIADTFDYPYIVEVSTTIKLSGGKTETKNGKFTFESASKCKVRVPHFTGSSELPWNEYDENFTKY